MLYSCCACRYFYTQIAYKLITILYNIQLYTKKKNHSHILSISFFLILSQILSIRRRMHIIFYYYITYVYTFLVREIRYVHVKTRNLMGI